MPYEKEWAIAAQNAATAAATLLQGTGVTVEVFEDVRRRIFNGTLELAGAESVVEVFEGKAEVAPADANVSQFQPRQAKGGSPTAQVAGQTVFKSGKHAGKSIADVYASTPDYIEWAAENMGRNKFMQDKCREFLAGVAA